MPRAFRDLRTAAELLASSRLPKEVKIRTQNLLNSKLLGAIQRTKGILGRLKTVATVGAVVTTGGSSVLAQQIGQYALKAAAKKALADAARRTQAAIEGKIGRAAASLGKNAIGSIGKLATSVSLGVNIIEETDPEKIRLPVTDGFSTNPSQATKQLSETAAKTVLSGVVSAPLGKGVSGLPILFRNKKEIESSKRFWDVRKAQIETLGTSTEPEPPTPAATSVVSALINQNGLLQDEIFYRLVLIAENIYKPLSLYAAFKNYGALTILEGFRSENGGTSPHERGEAIDITIGSGELSVAPTLFDIAKWAKDKLVFDQLILCHSLVPSPSGQAWLHITFSPESRRRLILTKTFNDEFVSGLTVYTQYSPAARAAAQAIADEDARVASEYIDRLATRNQELNPVGVNSVEGFTGNYGPGGEECWSYVDPFGQKYDPAKIKSQYESSVRDAFNYYKDTPLFDPVKNTGFRRNADAHRNFLFAVVQRVNDPKVGVTGIRGNANDASGDAIAILDPTGGPQGYGADKWQSTKRMCVIDIIGGAGSSGASFAWIDHTCPGSDSPENAVFISKDSWRVTDSNNQSPPNPDTGAPPPPPGSSTGPGGPGSGQGDGDAG